jgi:predicted transcriptional regulator
VTKSEIKQALRDVRDHWIMWSSQIAALKAAGFVRRDKKQDRYVLTEAGAEVLKSKRPTR